MAAVVWTAACQGPDAYYRNSGGLTGEGGSVAHAAGGAGPGARGGSGVGTGGVNVTGVAGTVGRGGSGTDAGAAGPGGAGSSAGGGSGAAGSTGTGCTATTCALIVLAECQTASSKQEIKVWLAVDNNRSTMLDLTTVTLRYWFTQDAANDIPGVAIDYESTPLKAANITTKFAALASPVTGANEYLELGFASGTAVVPAFQSSGYLELRLNDYSVTSWDGTQTDDYSFQACPKGQTAYALPFAGNPWPNITAYVNGVLTWGVEPQ